MASSGAFDWDDLRYFLEAAREHSLSGAARVLGVEHSTIGRRLGALESALGASLVLRGPEGLTLTPLGSKLLPLIEQVERAVVAVRDSAANESRRVRLAVPSGFTTLFTPGLAALGRERPGLSLEVVSGARPVDLERGEADLAVRAGTVKDSELIAKKLCSSGFALYASPDYLARSRPVNRDDLSGHELIGFDPALARVAPARWLAERDAGARVVLRSREMTDMLAAAVSGAGLAVLPCLLGDGEPGLVRVVPDVVASHPLWLVYRREARRSESVRVVRDFVVRLFKEHARRIAGTLPAAQRPASPT